MEVAQKNWTVRALRLNLSLGARPRSHRSIPCRHAACCTWTRARAAGIAQGEPVAIDADPNADSTAVSPPKYR